MTQIIIQTKTVTQQINEIQSTILVNLDKMFQDELTKYATKLSVLMANIGQEVAERESKYRQEFAKIAKDTPTLSAAKVEILALATEEHLSWKKAKAVELSVLETIKALKSRSNALMNEYKVVNNY